MRSSTECFIPPSVWATRLIHMKDMIQSFVWHSWFTSVDSTSLNRCVTRLHSQERHDSCLCVIWLIHKYDMIHPYQSIVCYSTDVWRASPFIRATWLIHIKNIIHSHLSTFTTRLSGDIHHLTDLHQSSESCIKTWLMHSRFITQPIMHESSLTYQCVMAHI